MPLFQPTNITPDMITGVQNGIVFAIPYPQSSTATVDISWTVNGNVQMLAYQIDFYKNNAASTSTGSTGKITLGTPFSGIDANGNEQRFTCQVPYTTVYNATVGVNRHEGKFKITQWWGATDDQSVVQRSLSVYRVNQHSSISVSGPTGSGGVYTFTGTFTPPDYSLNGEISLEWTRWQLYYDPDSIVNRVLLQDTGKIWGASGYTWTPTIIPPGTNYRVIFSALSSTGENLSASTSKFSSMADAVVFSEYMTAVCDPETQSVKLTISGTETEAQGRLYVNGAEDRFAEYCDQDGLVLPENSYAVWNVPLTTYAPWAFLWHGTIDALSQTPFFRLTLSDGSQVYFGYYSNITGIKANPPLASSLSVSAGTEMTVTISFGTTEATKNNLYWKHIRIINGSPISGSSLITGFTQKPVTKIEIFQQTTTKSWTLQWGENGLEPSDEETPKQDAAYLQFKTDALAGWEGKANLPLADFSGGDNGVIARSDGGLFASPICSISDFFLQDGMTVYDYSVANGSRYQYLAVIPETENSPPVAFLSDPVSPCFWSWALFEAEDEVDTNLGQYYLIQSYFFACNLSSGDNGNGAAPNISPTFTAYPSVMRDTQNRHSGTLAALVGGITAPGVYTDSNSLRDKIRALSTTKNTLFLRNRRGDFMRVAIAGEIVNATADNSVKQELSVRIPWVEIGPANRVVFRSAGGA